MHRFSLFFFCFLSCSYAQEKMIRQWTSAVGTTLEAKFIAEKMGYIRLEKADGSFLTVRLDQLSEADRMYVEQVTEVRGATEIEGIAAVPGKVSERITCQNDSQWHYYLYLPKNFHDGRKWPVWFIMSPGGGGNSGALNRYKAGAEMLGCILVLSVESKNGFDDAEFAVESMVEDVYNRLPVAEGLAFSSGMSGGSRMAYLLAEREPNIAGVLACGSGSGVYIKGEDFRDAKLRKSTYIYSLIGSNCFNRTGAFQSHDTFPDDYRLRFFPGKHDWAKDDLITEGMARVLGAGLEAYKGADAEKMSRDYTRQMWKWTQAQIKIQPWEAFYWADYLKNFRSAGTIQADAALLSRNLASDSKVQLALAAEKDMLTLADEYFRVFYKEDGKENPDRKNDAERMADKCPEIPHAELLKRLGDPS